MMTKILLLKSVACAALLMPNLAFSANPEPGLQKQVAGVSQERRYSRLKKRVT